MEIDNLKILKVCSSGCNGLSYGEQVILIQKHPQNNSLLLCSNNKGRVEYYHKENFYDNKKLIEVKKVVALHTNDDVKEGETYSIYNIIGDRYFLLNKQYILKNIENYYFIDKDEYDKIQEQPKEKHENLLNPYKAVLLQLHLEQVQKQKQEKELKEKQLLEKKQKQETQQKLEQERELKKEEDNRFKDLIQFICNHVNLSVNMNSDLKEVKKLNIFGYNISISQKNEVNNIVSEKIKQQEILNKLNKLSFETLGKIKFIENELILIHNLGFSIEICKLLKENLDAILVLYQYDTNDDTIKKTNELLDNIISYIEEIKTNKELEETYIKQKLVETINHTLDTNNEVIKSMISDTKTISKIFK